MLFLALLRRSRPKLSRRATSAFFAPAFALLLATCSISFAAPDATFLDALAELKRARAEIEGVPTSSAVIGTMNDKFFQRVPLASLDPEEIAELIRYNTFAYSEASPARAAQLAAQLAPTSSHPDVTGALAAALRVQLSRTAGITGTERAQWVAAAVQHPAFDALLNGDFGDIALDTALIAGMADPTYRDTVAAIAGKLDPAFPAAADRVSRYWTKIEAAIPEGERRQLLRGQLAAYLAAVLDRADPWLTPQRKSRLEANLAQLNSAAARGESLTGKAAPELHFLWTSEANAKTLSDLRGKIVVLDFWATWCGACVKAFPEVAKLAERYRGSDVVLLGVTSFQGAIDGLGGKAIDCRGDPEKEMRLMPDYMKAWHISWPVVISREPVINADFNIRGIPTTIVIAPDGTIRQSIEGFNETALITQIDALAQEFHLRGAVNNSQK